MRGNCCKQKIENNKTIKYKIKLSQKLLDVKEYTSVEGLPTTTRQCNSNDNNNNIKERLARSGKKKKGEVKISN